jgi:hypothetical protein
LSPVWARGVLDVKREVIERAQEARRQAEEAERRAVEEADTEEIEMPVAPVVEFSKPVEFEREPPIPPLLPEFTPDWDWVWTIVALVLWAIFVLGIGLSPAIAVIGAVVIVFTWQKRRPWADEYRPRWRGWPGL